MHFLKVLFVTIHSQDGGIGDGTDFTILVVLKTLIGLKTKFQQQENLT